MESRDLHQQVSFVSPSRKKQTAARAKKRGDKGEKRKMAVIFCQLVKLMRPPHDHPQVFIIRLSAELQNDGRGPKWALRGQVEHTRTGQAWHFVLLEDLPRILEVYLQAWLDEGQDPQGPTNCND